MEYLSLRLPVVVYIVCCSAVLIAYVSWVHSPVLDEVGHLPAGCMVARHGATTLYKVNPPLVKWLAAVPVVCCAPKYDWNSYSDEAGARTEWVVGRAMIEANGSRSFAFFTFGRWGLLVFWLIGSEVVYAWAKNLGGTYAGISAVVFWCFTPDVMAWSSTICPDSSAASLGVLSIFWFRKWVQDSSWSRAAIVGIVLGYGLLAKTSILVYVLVVPVVAMCHRNGRSVKTFQQLTAIGILAILIVNCGYGFAGSFRQLKNFQFFSTSLAGLTKEGALRDRVPTSAGNVFARTTLGDCPVPFPASFIEGLDLQKYDFEEGKWSYLRGEHKFGGWWYWYIYALLVKTPVGTILLFFVACGWTVWRVEWRRLFRWRAMRPSERKNEVPSSGLSATFSPDAGEKGVRTQPVLHENLILLAPAVCLFVLVSSQTGFSRYLRYVLPCYPFVFIWMSQIFSEKAGLPAWLRKVCWGLLAWSVISSLSVFPHSMSYFNELAGGPENGPAHLIDASIDWGQDVLFLADWVRQHPEAKPLYLSLHVFFDPRIAGIDYEHPPVDPRYSNQREYLTSDQVGPKPGWYSISVHQLYSRNKEFAYLFDFEKVDMVGYSIYIYHLTQEQVDNWNRKHGFAVAADSG